jgi:hypothetical protein
MAVALIKTAAYPIEKGVPIPARRTERVGRNAKYPLADMLVGDSIVIDKPQPAASGLVTGFGQRHGKKFTARRVDATHTRVWRIA